MRKELEPNLTRSYSVEKIITTSVSNIFFIPPLGDEGGYVFKEFQWKHGLIKRLGDVRVRARYAQGEIDGGRLINESRDIDPYLGLVCAKKLKDQEGNIIGLQEISLQDFHKVRKEDKDVDVFLKMRRFTSGNGMEEKLINNSLLDNQVESAADQIIKFFDKLPSLEESYGLQKTNELFMNLYHDILEAFSFNYMEQALNQVIDFTKIHKIKKNTEQFLSNNYEKFRLRFKKGRIKRGHGDTKVPNVQIGDGWAGDPGMTYFLDYIDFKEEWKINDLLSDLAYFMVYFDFHKPEQFDHWLNIVNNVYKSNYPHEIELKDDPLFWFYMNYRAMVQAKVAAIETLEFRKEGLNYSKEEANKKKAEADRFLELADKYLNKAINPASLNMQS